MILEQEIEIRVRFQCDGCSCYTAQSVRRVHPETVATSLTDVVYRELTEAREAPFQDAAPYEANGRPVPQVRANDDVLKGTWRIVRGKHLCPRCVKVVETVGADS